MKCSICSKKIPVSSEGWKGGCNAQPINNGTCCYDCDNSVVLPARLMMYGFKADEIKQVLTLTKNNEKTITTIINKGV